MKDILAQGFAEMGLPPSEESLEKLCRYADLLLEQNRVMNLTAITEPTDVARLHFLDSASIALWGGSGWLAGKTVLDVGTGAGFPGMVLKILEPGISLTLLDSTEKRVAWLEKVCEALSLDGVRFHHARAEELGHQEGCREGFDVVTSRAVAAFPALCELCLPFVRVGGVFLAMKSVESAAEVAAGQNAVKRLGGSTLEPVDYPIPGAGVTHRIVAVRKAAPTPAGYPRAWGKIKKAPL